MTSHRPAGRYTLLFAAALRNLWRRPFAAAAIGLPLLTIVALVSALTFYIDGVERDAMLAARAFPDILLQQQVGGRTESLLLDRYLDVLDNTPGIAAYEPRVWSHVRYTDRRGKERSFVLMGLRPEFVASGRLFSTAIQRGRPLRTGDQNHALVGAVVARALNADLGEVIEIQSPGGRFRHELEVIGTFATEAQIYAADLILTPIDTARAILGFYEEYECSDVLIYLDDPSRAEAVAATIAKAVEGARPLTKTALLELAQRSFGQRSGYYHLLWLVLLVNVLLIAWSVMATLRLGQKREIGILKALGWDTADVMLLKLGEVLTIGVGAVLGGLTAGLAYVAWGAPGMKRWIIGWADIYPDFPIPLYVEWSSVLLIAALGLLPLVAACILPVWRLSVVEPAEIIRDD